VFAVRLQRVLEGSRRFQAGFDAVSPRFGALGPALWDVVPGRCCRRVARLSLLSTSRVPSPRVYALLLCGHRAVEPMLAPASPAAVVVVTAPPPLVDISNQYSAAPRLWLDAASTQGSSAVLTRSPAKLPGPAHECERLAPAPSGENTPVATSDLATHMPAQVAAATAAAATADDDNESSSGEAVPGLTTDSDHPSDSELAESDADSRAALIRRRRCRRFRQSLQQARQRHQMQRHASHRFPWGATSAHTRSVVIASPLSQHDAAPAASPQIPGADAALAALLPATTQQEPVLAAQPPTTLAASEVPVSIIRDISRLCIKRPASDDDTSNDSDDDSDSDADVDSERLCSSPTLDAAGALARAPRLRLARRSADGHWATSAASNGTPGSMASQTMPHSAAAAAQAPQSPVLRSRRKRLASEAAVLAAVERLRLVEASPLHVTREEDVSALGGHPTGSARPVGRSRIAPDAAMMPDGQVESLNSGDSDDYEDTSNEWSGDELTSPRPLSPRTSSRSRYFINPRVLELIRTSSPLNRQPPQMGLPDQQGMQLAIVPYVSTQEFVQTQFIRSLTDMDRDLAMSPDDDTDVRHSSALFDGSAMSIDDDGDEVI
jgi:hypothetical protein